MCYVTAIVVINKDGLQSATSYLKAASRTFFF